MYINYGDRQHRTYVEILDICVQIPILLREGFQKLRAGDVAEEPRGNPLSRKAVQGGIYAFQDAVAMYEGPVE